MFPLGILCQKKAAASTLALYHFNSNFLDSSGNNRYLTGTATISSAHQNVKRSMRIGNYRAANPFPMSGTMDYLTVTEV